MIQFLKKIFNLNVMNSALRQFGSVSFQAFLLYAMFGIIVVVLIAIVKRIYEKKIRIVNILGGIMLSVYGSIMLQLTLVCRESGSRIGVDLDLFHGLLGPDNSFRWLMWAYMILNCLMFVPFGFIVSFFSLWSDRKWGVQLVTVTLISFMVSMCIECVQLVTQRGYYEVQDLVVNTFGGMIGWMLYRIFFCAVQAVMGKVGGDAK